MSQKDRKDDDDNDDDDDGGSNVGYLSESLLRALASETNQRRQRQQQQSAGIATDEDNRHHTTSPNDNGNGMSRGITAVNATNNGLAGALAHDDEHDDDDDSNQLFMSEPSVSEVESNSDNVARSRLPSTESLLLDHRGGDEHPLPPFPMGLTAQYRNSSYANGTISPGNTSLSSWESPHVGRVKYHFSPDRPYRKQYDEDEHRSNHSSSRRQLVKRDSGNGTSQLVLSPMTPGDADRRSASPAGAYRTSPFGGASDHQRSVNTSASSVISDGGRQRLQSFITDLRASSEGQLQQTSFDPNASFGSSYYAPNDPNRPNVNAIYRSVPAAARRLSATAEPATNPPNVFDGDQFPVLTQSSLFGGADDTVVMTLSASEDEADAVNADKRKQQQQQQQSQSHSQNDGFNTASSSGSRRGDSLRFNQAIDSGADDEKTTDRPRRSRKRNTENGRHHRRQRSGDAAAATLLNGSEIWKGMEQDNIPLPSIHGDTDDDESKRSDHHHQTSTPRRPPPHGLRPNTSNASLSHSSDSDRQKDQEAPPHAAALPEHKQNSRRARRDSKPRSRQPTLKLARRPARHVRSYSSTMGGGGGQAPADSPEEKARFPLPPLDVRTTIQSTLRDSMHSPNTPASVGSESGSASNASEGDTSASAKEKISPLLIPTAVPTSPSPVASKPVPTPTSTPSSVPTNSGPDLTPRAQPQLQPQPQHNFQPYDKAKREDPNMHHPQQFSPQYQYYPYQYPQPPHPNAHGHAHAHGHGHQYPHQHMYPQSHPHLHPHGGSPHHMSMVMPPPPPPPPPSHMPPMSPRSEFIAHIQNQWTASAKGSMRKFPIGHPSYADSPRSFSDLSVSTSNTPAAHAHNNNAPPNPFTPHGGGGGGGGDRHWRNNSWNSAQASPFSWLSRKKQQQQRQNALEAKSPSTPEEMTPLWPPMPSEFGDPQHPDAGSESDDEVESDSTSSHGDFRHRPMKEDETYVQRSGGIFSGSPFSNLNKQFHRSDRQRFRPMTSTVEDDGDGHPTYMCPNCKTRQREFFTVSSAPRQFESAAGYIAFYFSVYVMAALYIFGMQEGWPALDCIYFAVITLTTAGLGDLVPSTDGAKIMCSVFIYFGVACIGLLLGSYIAGMLDETSSREAKANRINSCPNCTRLQTMKDVAINGHLGHQIFLPQATSPFHRSPNMYVSERSFDDIAAMEPNLKRQRQVSIDRSDLKPVPCLSERPATTTPSRSMDSANSHFSFPDGTPTSTDSVKRPPQATPAVMQKIETMRLNAPEKTSRLHATTGHFGSPLTAQILGRQSHTRHESFDLNGRAMNGGGLNTTWRQRRFSVELPTTFEDGSGAAQNDAKSVQQTPVSIPLSSMQQSISNASRRVGQDFDSAASTDSSSDSSSKARNDLEEKYSPVKNAKYVFLTLREALLNSLLIIAFGCLGFYFIEGFSVVDSWYFTTVLLTTVGYGDITPVTKGGKLFATVYILVAGTILLNNMSLISMIPLELRKRRIEKAVLTQFGDQLDDAALRELATGPLVQRLNLSAQKPGGLDECTREMFALAMLVRLGKVTEEDIRCTFSAFRKLDVNKDGILNSKSIIAGMIKKRRIISATGQQQQQQQQPGQGGYYAPNAISNYWFPPTASGANHYQEEGLAAAATNTTTPTNGTCNIPPNNQTPAQQQHQQTPLVNNTISNERTTMLSHTNNNTTTSPAYNSIT